MNTKTILGAVIVLALVVIGAVYWQSGREEGVEANVSASPTSGTAPLSVSFYAPAGEAPEGTAYTIVYGDGDAGHFPACASAGCARPLLTHTYAKAGTYAAVVTKRTDCSAWECLGTATDIGTFTITVR